MWFVHRVGIVKALTSLWQLRGWHAGKKMMGIYNSSFDVGIKNWRER
tara:strand:+ start:3436 stop:3576 length:141 start_codon:yes stop_codon:yes gene_type:complete